MFKVIGSIPQKYPWETEQFSRVIDILRNEASKIGEWVIVLCDFDYTHYAGQILENDKSWNGQFDLLVLSPHRIIIYELKGFTTKIVCGTTSKANWKINRIHSDQLEECPSYFTQVSRQRAFLLSDFLRDYNDRYNLQYTNHYIVDARLVFKTGSDLSGFYFSVPWTENQNEFEVEVMSQVNNDADRDLLLEAFSQREPSTGKLMRQPLSFDKENRLRQIYTELNIKPRSQKWFRMITEDQIASDINNTGSDRFELKLEDAEKIASEFRYI